MHALSEHLQEIAQCKSFKELLVVKNQLNRLRNINNTHKLSYILCNPSLCAILELES